MASTVWQSISDIILDEWKPYVLKYISLELRYKRISFRKFYASAYNVTNHTQQLPTSVIQFVVHTDA